MALDYHNCRFVRYGTLLAAAAESSRGVVADGGSRWRLRLGRSGGRGMSISRSAYLLPSIKLIQILPQLLHLNLLVVQWFTWCCLLDLAEAFPYFESLDALVVIQYGSPALYKLVYLLFAIVNVAQSLLALLLRAEEVVFSLATSGS